MEIKENILDALFFILRYKKGFTFFWFYDVLAVSATN